MTEKSWVVLHKSRARDQDPRRERGKEQARVVQVRVGKPYLSLVKESVCVGLRLGLRCFYRTLVCDLGDSR